MGRKQKKKNRETKMCTNDHAEGDEGEQTEYNPHRSGGHGCLKRLLGAKTAKKEQKSAQGPNEKPLALRDDPLQKKINSIPLFCFAFTLISFVTVKKKRILRSL